jgi:ABC-type transporter Mla MlaB component
MVALAIRGPLARPDLPGLYARACALLTTCPAATVRCDVTGIGPDAVAVEALARLQLAARANGQRVELAGASRDLLAVIGLIGLDAVLPSTPCCAGRPRSR